MKVVLLSLVIAAVCGQEQRESKVVNIRQGPVRGYKVENHDVFSFYGIPYATAPTGNERFKPPLPGPSWTETLNAVNMNIRCPQFNRNVKYQEDCLVANVHIPDTDATNLPVMALIHGGGFMQGFSNSGTPHQLVGHKKNVIVVTFNYRVGPHGFLCLGTPDAPGNSGFKDQVAALKWIKENIASFGGNPDEITLAGCSAGGASADLHMLSKMSRGIFKRVIAQSGASIGAFAVQMDPIENSYNYARNIKYDGPDTPAALENFYKNLTYDELFSFDLRRTKDVAVVFSACIERDLGQDRFLHDSPISIIERGDHDRYPVLYGWANMEGLFRISLFDQWKQDMNEDFTEFIPADLQFSNAAQRQEYAQKIKQFYFGDTPVSTDDVLDYINFHSDAMFVVAMQRAVTLQVGAGNNNMYLSVYSYVNNATAPIPHTDVNGASHCTQSRAVLDTNESILKPEDIEMRRIMRELWLNFIYTGNPTPDGQIPATVPKWEPVSANRTPCMDLGSPIRVLPGPYTAERQAFWDNIYDQFRREPVPPSNLGIMFAPSFLIISFSIFYTIFVISA